MNLYVRDSQHIEEYLHSNMVACEKNLNNEGEVQNTLSYINFNNIIKGKAEKKSKKKFFVSFTGTYIPKKALFGLFFVPHAKGDFCFFFLRHYFLVFILFLYTNIKTRTLTVEKT